MLDFKFGELNKEVLVESLVTEFSQRSFIKETSLITISVRLFKFGCFDVRINLGEIVNKFLKNLAALIQITASLFKLQKCIPGIFTRDPCHPISENLSDFILFAKHLLHVGILVPKLVYSWKVLACPFPYIPGMIDKLVAHLYLSIFKPEGDMFEVNIDGSLEYRS